MRMKWFDPDDVEMGERLTQLIKICSDLSFYNEEDGSFGQIRYFHEMYDMLYMNVSSLLKRDNACHEPWCQNVFCNGNEIGTVGCKDLLWGDVIEYHPFDLALKPRVLMAASSVDILHGMKVKCLLRCERDHLTDILFSSYWTKGINEYDFAAVYNW